MHSVTYINISQFQVYLGNTSKRQQTLLASALLGTTLTLHSLKKFRISPVLAFPEFLLGISFLALSIWLKVYQKPTLPSLVPTMSTEETLFRAATNSSGMAISKETHKQKWQSLTEEQQFALEKRIIDFELNRLSQGMAYNKLRDRIGLDILKKHKDDHNLIARLRDAAMHLENLTQICTEEEISFLGIPEDFLKQNQLQNLISQMGRTNFASLDANEKKILIHHLANNKSINYLDLRTQFGFEALIDTPKGTKKLLKDKFKSYVICQTKLTFIELQTQFSKDLSHFFIPLELEEIEFELMCTKSVLAKHNVLTYTQLRNCFSQETLEKHILKPPIYNLFLESFFKNRIGDLRSSEYDRDFQLLNINLANLQQAIKEVEDIPIEMILKNPHSYKILTGHPIIQKKALDLIQKTDSFDIFFKENASYLSTLVDYHWIDCENPIIITKLNNFIRSNPIRYILQGTDHVTGYSKVYMRIRCFNLMELYSSFKQKYFEQICTYKHNPKQQQHYISESLNRDFYHSLLQSPSTDPATLSLVRSNFETHKKRSGINEQDWKTHQEFLAQLSKDFIAQLT